MNRIIVIRKQDELHLMEWDFYFMENDGTLYLDNYCVQERATIRHKFKSVKVYHRIDGRNNTISEQDVPLPDDVKAEAIQQFVSQLSVKKWKESGR